MTLWETLLTGVGTWVVLIIPVGWVLKMWLETHLKGSIKAEYEAKQIELKAELQGHLEGVRAGYQRFLDENQIRFSRLHADRAAAIKELYTRVAALENALSVMVHPVQPSSNGIQNTHKQTALKSYTELQNYFCENRIFFSEEDADVIEKLLETAEKVFCDYTTYDQSSDTTPRDKEDQRQLRLESYNAMCHQFPPLRASLEKHFREALGLVEAQVSHPED